MTSTIHGRIDEVRRSSSSTDVSPADVAIPPRAIPPPAHPPPKLTSNDAGGKRYVSSHVPKDRRKVTRAPCGRNIDDRVDKCRNIWFGDMITADHKVLHEEQESRFHHKDAVVVQDLATQWNQKLSMQNPYQLRKRRELFEKSYV